MKQLLIAVLALTGSATVGWSQQARKVQFRTLCLDYAADIHSVGIPSSSRDVMQKFDLYTDLSPVVEGVFASNEASFYIEKPPGADGKPVHELVARTTIGASDHQLFIFVAG